MEVDYRTELTERRERLTLVGGEAPAPDIDRLLQEVDAALARLDDGTFGICEICHDAIEPERLARDPVIRYCVDHLTDEERQFLERDMDLATRIQREMLPKADLCCSGWDAAFHYQAARSVGGDYCDLIEAEDGILFVLGDVSGKGVAASMMMSCLRTIVRSEVGPHEPLDAIMGRVNRLFGETTVAPLYATLVLGRAEENGRVELVNAGHCPPLRLGRDGIHDVPATGVPVGLFSHSRYETAALSLAEGERILLYTDGLSETRSADGVELGAAGISRIAREVEAASAHALVEALAERASAYRGTELREDDLSILVVQRMARPH